MSSCVTCVVIDGGAAPIASIEDGGGGGYAFRTCVRVCVWVWVWVGRMNVFMWLRGSVPADILSRHAGPSMRVVVVLCVYESMRAEAEEMHVCMEHMPHVVVDAEKKEAFVIIPNRFMEQKIT